MTMLHDAQALSSPGAKRAALSSVALAALLLIAPLHSARAATAAKPAPKASGVKVDSLAPLTSGVAWSHAPFEVGECGICHKSNDPKSPGPLLQATNKLCLSCHEGIAEMMKAGQAKHEAAEESCTNCHNPHNARYRMLLRAPVGPICYQCHDEIQTLAEKSPVRHDAVIKDKACVNCHNPHASKVDKLLHQLPYDLCINCHDKDDMKDSDGKPLTNIKKLLAENEVWHKPVKDKDCSACHNPHGSKDFRLLRAAYPDKFYAPYDPTHYALCFKCHNDKILADAETTTLTKFRDGNKNLHFKHVHKEDRGRTCRACHEVHAAKKPHQIRDGVPYGTSGWMLPVKYESKKDGGECSKTCHSTRQYNNKKQ